MNILKRINYILLLLMIASQAVAENNNITITSREIVERLTRLKVMLIENKKTSELQFNSISQRFIDIDKRLDGMDKRLDGMDKRLDGMDKRLDGMDKRLDGMDKRLDDFKWLIGIFFTLAVIICGFFYKLISQIQKNISAIQHNLKEKEDIKENVPSIIDFQKLSYKVDKIIKHLNLSDIEISDSRLNYQPA